MEIFYVTSVLITISCMTGVYFLIENWKRQRESKSFNVEFRKSLEESLSATKKSIDEINFQLKTLTQNGDKNNTNLITAVKENTKAIEKGVDTLDTSLKETVKLD